MRKATSIFFLICHLILNLGVQNQELRSNTVQSASKEKSTADHRQINYKSIDIPGIWNFINKRLQSASTSTGCCVSSPVKFCIYFCNVKQQIQFFYRISICIINILPDEKVICWNRISWHCTNIIILPYC
jgi:hypothetical protein